MPAIPNLDDWQPGDVLLVRGASGSTWASVIHGVQGSILSGQPPLGDPSWTHVALYVADGLLLETVPKQGVRYCQLSHYCTGRDVRLRRLVRQGLPIPPAQGVAVVAAAAELFGQKYSYSSIATHLLSQAKVSAPNAFFCSSFVSIAFQLGLKVLLERSVKHRPLLPATLANHPDFHDVDLDWCQPT